MHTDIISQILEKAEARDEEFSNELLTFLDDGVCSILGDKKEPYFTIAKNKIRHLIIFDRPLGDTTKQSYTEQMVIKLNGLYLRLDESDKFSRAFIEICLDCVKEGEYLNKDALSMLNEINTNLT